MTDRDELTDRVDDLETQYDLADEADGRDGGVIFETEDGTYVDADGDPIGEDYDGIFVIPWSLTQQWLDTGGTDAVPAGAPILDEEPEA